MYRRLNTAGLELELVTHGGGDALCEEGPAREFGLVPVFVAGCVSGSFWKPLRGEGRGRRGLDTIVAC